MARRIGIVIALLAVGAVFAISAGKQGELLVRVNLSYQAPGSGSRPNFSPKGTQVPLADLPPSEPLPRDAFRPAKFGIIRIGPDASAWIPVLATSDGKHPTDLCRIFLDRNRNGDFTDDRPGQTAIPMRRDKTGAWWSSFSGIELVVPYGPSGRGGLQPYMVSVWLVREGESPPEILRYSVSSWRSGGTSVDGVDVLAAMMDSNNDAVFDRRDYWSILSSAEPDADRRVLSRQEARPANRFMFVQKDGKELVLEFRSVTPDGRAMTFAVVDRPVTKAEDRAPDDTVAAERTRPRTKKPFIWSRNLAAASNRAKVDGKKVIIDFETDWCGPCKMMDQWIWTDAEVASLLNGGYLGVKLDGDVEKEAVKRFKVIAYPTVVVLDSTGAELLRFVGYRSSKEVLESLGSKR